MQALNNLQAFYTFPFLGKSQEFAYPIFYFSLSFIHLSLAISLSLSLSIYLSISLFIIISPFLSSYYFFHSFKFSPILHPKQWIYIMCVQCLSLWKITKNFWWIQYLYWVNDLSPTSLPFCGPITNPFYVNSNQKFTYFVLNPRFGYS